MRFGAFTSDLISSVRAEAVGRNWSEVSPS
jgi:hypothetical protein